MYNEKGILGNQLVVMSREDFDNLVNEAAQNIVAAQTKKNDYSGWLTMPDGDRFISREEASELLRVDFPHCGDGTRVGCFVARRLALVV